MQVIANSKLAKELLLHTSMYLISLSVQSDKAIDQVALNWAVSYV